MEAAVGWRGLQAALAGAEAEVIREAVTAEEEVALAGAETDVILERARLAAAGP